MYKGVNYSKETITIGWEDELVTFNKLELLNIINLIREVRKRNVKKTELKTLNINILLKIDKELYDKIKETKQNNETLFELALTLVD